jgi:hypothetical protein
MAGAAQQALHPARPFLLLDFDQGLEFSEMMGVDGGLNPRISGGGTAFW